jgi:anti-sigma factor RsiW
MKPYELTELMHAVLDGEATPAEARNLERILAADADARAEFDSLRALFDELKGVPQALPPEGLVASVMADLPSSQLSAPSRVIGARAQAGSPISDMARRESRSVPFSGSRLMKRKVIFVGAGVAALAVILLASSGIDFPPGGTNTTGAIVPAQRFRADQPATTGVSATGQSESAQRASQGTQGNTGDARSSDARASDSLKANGRADSVSDGRANDARANDGRANDARANDGRSDGRADAMKDGRADAMKDGRSDAMKDGRSDAMKDGRADAMKDGRSDAMKDGRSDAMKDGRSDNMKDGRVSQ